MQISFGRKASAWGPLLLLCGPTVACHCVAWATCGMIKPATIAIQLKTHGIRLGIRSPMIALLSSCPVSAEPRGYVVQRPTTASSSIAPRRSPVKVGAWHGDGKVAEEFDFECLPSAPHAALAYAALNLPQGVALVTTRSGQTPPASKFLLRFPGFHRHHANSFGF